jgi:hypothetical protein
LITAIQTLSISCKPNHFPLSIIARAVGLCFLIEPSLLEVEEMLLECCVDVSYWDWAAAGKCLAQVRITPNGRECIE